jgi:nucleoside-diphosphate-sugar epimerase
LDGSQNILVTGGAGFVGSRLVIALVSAGHRVVVADNLVSTGSLWLLDEVRGRFEFVHVDIRCPEDFDRLPRRRYDRVYHLAASFANELSVELPLLDHRTNVEGTENLLRFLSRVGTGQIVYTGSSSSYGDAEPPFSELTTAPTPTTPYASSKLAAERLVAESGLPYAIFRLFNVYGPGDVPGAYRNAIPNMMRALSTPDGAIKLFGEEATRDFTFVDDVVRVLLRSELATGRIVNVATGRETRITDLVTTLLALFDLPDSRVRRLPRREWDRVVRRVADISQLRELYGEVPATTLAEGLPRTARWLAAAGLLTRSP